jgi:hypothetical protein
MWGVFGTFAAAHLAYSAHLTLLSLLARPIVKASGFFDAARLAQHSSSSSGGRFHTGILEPAAAEANSAGGKDDSTVVEANRFGGGGSRFGGGEGRFVDNRSRFGGARGRFSDDSGCRCSRTPARARISLPWQARLPGKANFQLAVKRNQAARYIRCIAKPHNVYIGSFQENMYIELTTYNLEQLSTYFADRQHKIQRDCSSDFQVQVCGTIINHSLTGMTLTACRVENSETRQKVQTTQQKLGSCCRC